MGNKRQQELLKRIDELKKADIRAAIAEVRKEYDHMKKSAAKAERRAKAQAKSGDTRGAELSRNAFNYCRRYAEQLWHMIDGMEHQLKGNVVFTKDGTNRYRDAKDYRNLM